MTGFYSRAIKFESLSWAAENTFKTNTQTSLSDKSWQNYEFLKLSTKKSWRKPKKKSGFFHLGPKYVHGQNLTKKTRGEPGSCLLWCEMRVMIPSIQLMISGLISWFFFLFFYSFKMIGFAQGREPGVSRRVIATLESIVSAQIISSSATSAAVAFAPVSSFVSSNCLENAHLNEASCNFLSLCAPFDNEIEVLDFVGSLNASAQISQSAWSQWNVVRQIIATTQKR